MNHRNKLINKRWIARIYKVAYNLDLELFVGTYLGKIPFLHFYCKHANDHSEFVSSVGGSRLQLK